MEVEWVLFVKTSTKKNPRENQSWLIYELKYFLAPITFFAFVRLGRVSTIPCRQEPKKKITDLASYKQGNERNQKGRFSSTTESREERKPEESCAIIIKVTFIFVFMGTSQKVRSLR